MTVTKAIWMRTRFTKNLAPQYPCPHCEHGRLSVLPKSFVVHEPKWSENQHQRDEWEPEWIKERFSVFFQCSVPSCGEIVVVVGDTETVSGYEEDESGESTPTYDSVFVPRAMFPAPPIFPIPKETPEAVAVEIKLAFASFWSDPAASTTHIRTSIERIMDHFKIPKTQLTKSRKRKPRTLAARLDLFSSKHPSASILHVLRQVGNTATHDSLEREPLVDVCSVYEGALVELFSKDKEKLERMANKLKKTKGKYKKPKTLSSLADF